MRHHVFYKALFTLHVTEKLIEDGFSSKLSDAEKRLIDTAIYYEVGPIDTACQIEADRNCNPAEEEDEEEEGNE